MSTTQDLTFKVEHTDDHIEDYPCKCLYEGTDLETARRVAQQNRYASRGFVSIDIYKNGQLINSVTQF